MTKENVQSVEVFQSLSPHDETTLSDFQQVTSKRNAWSDNDLFYQNWTNKDMSENFFEFELSSSCQKLSEKGVSNKNTRFNGKLEIMKSFLFVSVG